MLLLMPEPIGLDFLDIFVLILRNCIFYFLFCCFLKIICSFSFVLVFKQALKRINLFQGHTQTVWHLPLQYEDFMLTQRVGLSQFVRLLPGPHTTTSITLSQTPTDRAQVMYGSSPNLGAQHLGQPSSVWICLRFSKRDQARNRMSFNSDIIWFGSPVQHWTGICGSHLGPSL